MDVRVVQQDAVRRLPPSWFMPSDHASDGELLMQQERRCTVLELDNRGHDPRSKYFKSPVICCVIFWPLDRTPGFTSGMANASMNLVSVVPDKMSLGATPSRTSGMYLRTASTIFCDCERVTVVPPAARSMMTL